MMTKKQQEIFDKVKQAWEAIAGPGRVDGKILEGIIVMADTNNDGKKRIVCDGDTYLVPIEDIIIDGVKAVDLFKYPKEKKEEIKHGQL